MDFRDLTEACAHRIAGGIEHAAALDEQGEVPLAVHALNPAVAVAIVVEFELADRLQIVAEVFVELRQNPVRAVVIDCIFHPRVLALRAAAEIALHQHYFLCHIGDLIDRAETDHIREPRIGILRAVGHAHPAADRDIEADQLSALDDGDERQAVRVDIDIVRWRHRDGDLEFPRQVGLAVDRLEILLARFHFFTIQPNLVVGAGGGCEVVGNLLGNFQNLRVHPGEIGVGVAHHVAVHVSASRDGIHRRLIDLRNRALEVRLDDAVELERLARGQLNRAVRELRGEAIRFQPLLRGGDTARHADADHEGIRLVELVLTAIRAQVAIVLLVGAVEFQQLLVILAHRSGGKVGKTFLDRPAQIVAADLDGFVGR